MILDLTLDALKFPGLENYTPPFGTKKGDNVGLTTAEGCANLAMPWQDQRPIVISENSSTSANIERNATIEIDTASVTLTINDAIFKNCKLTILTTFSSGTATLLHGQVSTTLQAGFENVFRFDGTNWINASPMFKAYPVGAYYLSEDDTTPEKLLGFGTWSRVAGNATIWGTSGNSQAGQTKAAGLPDIQGSFGATIWADSYSNSGAFTKRIPGNSGKVTSGSNEGAWDFKASTYNAIYGNSTTVQPPARTVNIWKRIA